ncbi:hypothetical protein RND81_14G063800 [Saponaria officinalis]|uniref:Uncharacterized protein n=1 Tax=Saponaria officinalis TaxID=3572 RepID=A0AAW1GJ73_SAPOF
MISSSTLKVVKDAPRPDRGRTSIPLLLSNHTTPDRLHDQGVLQRKQRHVKVQSRSTKRKSGHHREVRQRNARLVARHMETHRRVPETIDERPQNQQNGPRLLTPSRYNTPPRDHVAKRTTIQKLPRPRGQNLLVDTKRSGVPRETSQPTKTPPANDPLRQVTFRGQNQLCPVPISRKVSTQSRTVRTRRTPLVVLLLVSLDNPLADVLRLVAAAKLRLLLGLTLGRLSLNAPPAWSPSSSNHGPGRACTSQLSTAGSRSQQLLVSTHAGLVDLVSRQTPRPHGTSTPSSPGTLAYPAP